MSRRTSPRCRAFARGCAAVTLDHEQVPSEHLRALVADGVAVHPGPDALRHAQDKLVMRRRLADLGIPGPAFAEVDDPDRLTAFVDAHGPAVLKAVRGGYDGRGVWLDPTVGLVGELLATGTPLMVEQRVPMRRELAAMVARSPFGQAAAWPVVETVQADGQCVEVLAPAPGLADERAAQAQELALRIGGRAGRHRAAGRRAVRADHGRDRGQRAGHAPAQLRALDDRGRAHVAVRAAPARGARLPARGDDAHRARRRHGERAGGGAAWPG